jgi:RNA recognition motif-containing protein
MHDYSSTDDYHIFVGDLSYEIDANTLQKEFDKFGEVT